MAEVGREHDGGREEVWTEECGCGGLGDGGRLRSWRGLRTATVARDWRTGGTSDGCWT